MWGQLLHVQALPLRYIPYCSLWSLTRLKLYARLVLLHQPPVLSPPKGKHLPHIQNQSSVHVKLIYISIYIERDRYIFLKKNIFSQLNLVWILISFVVFPSPVFLIVPPLSHPLNVQHGPFHFPQDGSDLTTSLSVPHAGNPSCWDNKLGLTTFITCAIYLHFRPTSSFYEQDAHVITEIFKTIFAVISDR